MTGALVSRFPKIKGAIDSLKPTILWIGRAFFSVWDQVTHLWEQNGPWITAKFTKLADWVSHAFESVAEALSAFWNEHGDTIKSIFAGIVATGTKLFNILLGLIKKLWPAVQSALGLILPALEGLLSVIGTILDGITVALQKLGILQGEEVKSVEVARGARNISEEIAAAGMTDQYAPEFIAKLQTQENDRVRSAVGSQLLDSFAKLGPLNMPPKAGPAGTLTPAQRAAGAADNSTTVHIGEVHLETPDAAKSLDGLIKGAKRAARVAQNPMNP